MKTKRLLNIFLLSSLVTIAACTEEETGDEGVVTTLWASIEQKAETKTHLSGPDNNVYKTLWSEDDAIGVFAGSSNASEFKLTSGAGTNSGEFTGTIPSGNRIAVYPYSICESIKGSSISVVLPEEQTYKVGNIPDGAYPMVAAGGENTLNFKNLCSVLKISMTGSLTVNYIRFSANNSKIKVSGGAVINIDPDSPELIVSEEGNSYVKLVCPAVTLSNNATEFYIVVPAQKYTGGFTLMIDTDKGKVQKTIETDVTLKRSELYRITPFECKIEENNQNIIFEDENFKAYLISKFDKNNDGEISFDEANNILSLSVCTDSIVSISGIEFMPNLIKLFCNGTLIWGDNDERITYGHLKTIDISHNSRLEVLQCNNNNIKSLDVSNNLRLYEIECAGNYIETMDLKKNPNIIRINCGYNNITSLDISCCPRLNTLWAHNNHLTTINTTNNQLLSTIDISHNNISSLDLQNNQNLTYFQCIENKLTSINFRNCPKLRHLYIHDNSLHSIDICSNQELKHLSVSNNPISSIDVSKNSKLISLLCDQCLLSHIDLSHNTNLEDLSCNYNSISTLDLKNLTSLSNLQAAWNELTFIDVPTCVTIINIPYNKLTSFDTSKYPDLAYFDCSYNSIKSLDFRNCTKLTKIGCRDNNLYSLKIGNNTNLEIIYCQNNNLNTIDISHNTGIKYFNCEDNPLNTLYTYQDQLNKIAEVYLPDNVTVIVGSEPGEDEVFSVTPTLFDIDGNEQDITMTVTANMDYSVNSVPEWISKKSENSGTYTFTVSANTTSSARSGEIIFKNVNNSLLTVTVKQGIQTYTSSDYSQDGQVTRIHSATVGKGIDVVFVGDAFADKDQDLFNKYVKLGKEAFFTEEPFRSTKDRFNIYRIGSVSKNGIIAQEGGDTKFSAQFGDGTYISGDHDAVFRFVQDKMPSVNLKKTIVFVIVNKAKYAGTCWMFSDNKAVCYVPLCRDETDYAQTLRHEGCGHGFGKLADEYFYDSMGRIPDDKVTELKQWKVLSYGFYENVDLTSDPNTIAWARFISDSRYSGKVGVYEGGYTYPYGVYRPTDNSIMRYNTGGFNAPSREAIYKKIMKFSEGDAWTYDYETFVAFDAPARSAEAVTRAAAQCAAVDKANFIPLAPPVMVMVDK